MNKSKIQTKRKTKTGFRTYFARTATKDGKKTQRAATATAEDIRGEIPQVGIGRALTIILVLHIVAIAALYLGTNWRGESDEVTSTTTYNDDQDSNSKGTGESGKLNVGTPSSYQDEDNETSGDQQGNENPVSDRPLIEVPQSTPRIIMPRINPNLVGQPAVTDAPQLRGSVKKHKVASGDTGYGLARKYGVKFSALQAVNKGVNLGRLKIGQMLNIPTQ